MREPLLEIPPGGGCHAHAPDHDTTSASPGCAHGSPCRRLRRGDPRGTANIPRRSRIRPGRIGAARHARAHHTDCETALHGRLICNAFGHRQHGQVPARRDALYQVMRFAGQSNDPGGSSDVSPSLGQSWQNQPWPGPMPNLGDVVDPRQLGDISQILGAKRGAEFARSHGAVGVCRLLRRRERRTRSRYAIRWFCRRERTPPESSLGSYRRTRPSPGIRKRGSSHGHAHDKSHVDQRGDSHARGPHPKREVPS